MRLAVHIMLLGFAASSAAQDALPPPNLLHPPDSSWRWTSDCLEWEAVPSANSYRLQVLVDTTRFIPVYDLVTNGTFICENMEDGFYKWHVAALGGTSSSEWSEWWHFEVRFPVDVEEFEIAAKHLPLMVFPNPVRSRGYVRFDVTEAAVVEISLFNLLGRRVGTLVDSFHYHGRHEAEIDSSTLSAGVYFVRLKAGDRIETTSLVVVP